MVESSIYWTKIKLLKKTLYVMASDKGLVFIGGKEAADEWLGKNSGADLVKSSEKTRPYVVQLQEYSQGKRQDFDLPYDLAGTDFQTAVWRALTQVPYGETTTYSAIAKKIGREKAVRAVGSAVGANPLLIIVPCHRVVQKSGQLGQFREGVELKHDLLELEGVFER